MDDDLFEAWLDGIRWLTTEQRGQGLRALTLVEAADVSLKTAAAGANAEFADTPITGSMSGTRVGTVVRTEAVVANEIPAAVGPEAVSLATAAQTKVDLTGCPHCRGQSLQRWGYASGLPRYRCGDCRRSFNALTGTPLARLRMKERWASQIQALITGESLVKAAKRCDVDVTTAFRWRHRFLSAPALDKPGQLTGIVEADETYILESDRKSVV